MAKSRRDEPGSFIRLTIFYRVVSNIPKNMSVMAMKIITGHSDNPLTFKSHWWGFPDLPERVCFPVFSEPESNIGSENDESEDLLTFICQIRMEDIAPFDRENKLPHKGMLYFFADIDYFLGDPDARNGKIGLWSDGCYKVIYTHETDNLYTHRVVWEDGSEACMAAETMCFKASENYAHGHKLLGMPFFDEVREEASDYISLLQIDEDERWGLRFYDCGMLNFLITEEDLAARRFDKVKLYFHCM